MADSFMLTLPNHVSLKYHPRDLFVGDLVSCSVETGNVGKSLKCFMHSTRENARSLGNKLLENDSACALCFMVSKNQ